MLPLAVEMHAREIVQNDPPNTATMNNERKSSVYRPARSLPGGAAQPSRHQAEREAEL